TILESMIEVCEHPAEPERTNEKDPQIKHLQQVWEKLRADMDVWLRWLRTLKGDTSPPEFSKYERKLNRLLKKDPKKQPTLEELNQTLKKLSEIMGVAEKRLSELMGNSRNDLSPEDKIMKEVWERLSDLMTALEPMKDIWGRLRKLMGAHS